MLSCPNANDKQPVELTGKSITLGTACFRCRGFRHACDRKKPSCARCYRRGINCVYPEAAPTLKKLQKATVNLGDRIKRFNDKVRSSELFVQQKETANVCQSKPLSWIDDVDLSMIEQQKPKRCIIRRGKVASTSNFSIYPCEKCFKDLQQCDLTFPRCSRCEANSFECGYKKAEPKAIHVSQVLLTMNRIMDQWQDSIDRVAKNFARKTRDFSVKANNTLNSKPTPQTFWKITTTRKGMSIESNVNTFNDLSRLIDHFKRTMSISSRDSKPSNRTKADILNNANAAVTQRPQQQLAIDAIFSEFDDTSSIRTTTGFAVWNSWASSTQTIPQDYPLDITQELTDNLIDLYCRTPCCSSIRLPIIDTEAFFERYHNPDPAKKPSTVLVYAICAMVARNAFQLHVWNKRPANESPNYNMGKALSVAYCLRGRELLSECFDEPTFEHCQAAFLLSYCNYQNGYTNVIYYYEWIAYTMAQELGLYDKTRQLTRYESMLIWCIYDCNAWYKALRGGDGACSTGLSQCKPSITTLPSVLPRPNSDAPAHVWIEYYVWNSWVYQIQLQLLRDRSITALVMHEGLCDSVLPQSLLALQNELQRFHEQLPSEWRPSIDTSPTNVYVHSINAEAPFLHPSSSSASDCCSSTQPNTYPLGNNDAKYHVNIEVFSQYCIQLVHLHFYINQIILYQPFVPMHRVPSTPLSLQSLQISLSAAAQMTNTFRHIIRQHKACYVPLIGFVFTNVVYRKLLSYTTDDQYYEVGKLGLLQSIELSKLSTTYTYDFEMARTLVGVMEHDTQYITEANTANSNPYMMSTIDSSSSALSTIAPQTPLALLQ